MILAESLTENLLPEDLAEDEKRLVKELRLYEQKATVLTDSTAFYQNKVFETVEKLEKILGKAGKKDLNKVTSFYSVKRANLKSIQNSLDDQTLYIDYSNEQDAMLILTVSKNKVELVSVLANETFEEDISKLYNLLKDPFLAQKVNRNKFIDVSNRLYKVLIAPIEKELEGKSRLTIVGEEGLFYVPFEILLPSNEKKSFDELAYLIKNYELNYQYSGTIYQRTQNKPVIEDRSFLAFAPVFGRKTPKYDVKRSAGFITSTRYRSVKNNRLIPLPNTKKEVETINQMLQTEGETIVLLENNATKANYSKQVEQKSYQFVHIATHGLVNYQNPKLSALACYPNDDKINDFLFANEVQFQSINADLVVLSSCESGIGFIKEGEGMLALNRSFIYAGARNVLFSLWKVSDQESSTLMIDFYKEYLKNPSYTAALRQAKLNMISNPKTALPTYWAPFILIGE